MTLLLLAPMSPFTLFAVLGWAILFVMLVGLAYWAVNKLCLAFGIGEPIKSVVIVVIVVVAVLSLAYFLISNLTTWHP